MAFGKRVSENVLPVRGVLPDDRANPALTPQRMRAMDDAAIGEMNALVAKVNAHIPGVIVLPWAIIPWVVWKDQNAVFLMQSNFLPSSPWNNMLLPADAKSSTFLGLPEHPRAAMPELDENISQLIHELRANSQGTKDDHFQKLFALTRYTATMVFGEAVLARHDELFGMGLKGVTG